MEGIFAVDDPRRMAQYRSDRRITLSVLRRKEFPPAEILIDRLIHADGLHLMHLHYADRGDELGNGACRENGSLIDPIVILYIEDSEMLLADSSFAVSECKCYSGKTFYNPASFVQHIGLLGDPFRARPRRKLVKILITNDVVRHGIIIVVCFKQFSSLAYEYFGVQIVHAVCAEFVKRLFIDLTQFIKASMASLGSIEISLSSS